MTNIFSKLCQKQQSKTDEFIGKDQQKNGPERKEDWELFYTQRDNSKYFAILGLTYGASQEKIKAAYRHRVKKCHPEMGGNLKEFQAVQEAYKFLTENFKSA